MRSKSVNKQITNSSNHGGLMQPTAGHFNLTNKNNGQVGQDKFQKTAKAKKVARELIDQSLHADTVTSGAIENRSRFDLIENVAKGVKIGNTFNEPISFY